MSSFPENLNMSETPQPSCLWKAPCSPSEFRELNASKAPQTWGEITVVYNGGLEEGQPVPPMLGQSKVETTSVFTNFPTVQEFKNAIIELFEGDLDAGNRALIDIEERLIQAHNARQAAITQA
jgi:hypothetical protein